MLQLRERDWTQEEAVIRINYPKVIQEREEDPLSLEQRLRGQKPADRVRMLRLLKSMKDCAPLVGYSLVQLTRW